MFGYIHVKIRIVKVYIKVYTCLLKGVQDSTEPQAFLKRFNYLEILQFSSGNDTDFFQ